MELTRQLQDSNCKIIFCSDSRARQLVELKKICPKLQVCHEPWAFILRLYSLSYPSTSMAPHHQPKILFLLKMLFHFLSRKQLKIKIISMRIKIYYFSHIQGIYLITSMITFLILSGTTGHPKGKKSIRDYPLTLDPMVKVWCWPTKIMEPWLGSLTSN